MSDQLRHLPIGGWGRRLAPAGEHGAGEGGSVLGNDAYDFITNLTAVPVEQLGNVLPLSDGGRSIRRLGQRGAGAGYKRLG
jgi:hypothetical protein